ncbi:MAG: glycosyltransferase [Candidatus Thermoplasmatota archaeon]|jgi:dolichol-phosphate mannosyltransferase|nr:glycosyltransferase [Candidatus Thermoplasmatota archaeon]MCL5955392.1 glycosyltransferase [Candidatus Thermoplasmatota archaeon]
MAGPKVDSVAIILPVVNERANLENLLPELEDYTVYVVDDGSTDGTQQICTLWGNVHLVERHRRMGLVSAILEGFKRLPLTCKYAVVMDSDFSHNPSYIPDLLRSAMDKQADLVVGSRYVPGGKNGDAVTRRIISLGGNIAFRSTFSARVKDATSGFRVYSAQAMEFLLDSNLEEPISPSYAGQIDIMRRLIGSGFRVYEHPIKFVKRSQGKSKLKFDDIQSFASLIFRKGNIGRYVIVGLSGILVNFLILTLLYGYMGFPASPLAVEASVVSNFVLNDRFTFRKRATKTSSTFLFRLARFNLFSLLGLGVNSVVFYGLYSEMLKSGFATKGSIVGIGIADFVGIVCAFLVTYLSSTFYVWRESEK